MTGYYWIKYYVEVLDDPKMAILPDRLWRRFFELCLFASEYDRGGELPDTPSIAWRLRMETDDIALDLPQLAAVKLIKQIPGGWFITNFAKRQAPSPAKERMKQYRERQHKDQYYGTEKINNNETVTKRNPYVTQINRLTESYIDSDRKIDGEVFSSFQNNICNLTPIISEKLQTDIDEFGKDWCMAAIKVASENNGRTYNYVHTVLENRKKGYIPGKNGAGHSGKQKYTDDYRNSDEGRERYANDAQDGGE